MPRVWIGSTIFGTSLIEREGVVWRIDTPWFDVAVVMGIFAIGNILFGHFEEHRPKWRRLLKVALVLAIVIGLATTLGRRWAYAALMLPLIGAAVVHLWWLPRHGINGWTGEPREAYLQLVGARKSARGPKEGTFS